MTEGTSGYSPVKDSQGGLAGGKSHSYVGDTVPWGRGSDCLKGAREENQHQEFPLELCFPCAIQWKAPILVSHDGGGCSHSYPQAHGVRRPWTEAIEVVSQYHSSFSLFVSEILVMGLTSQLICPRQGFHISAKCITGAPFAIKCLKLNIWKS